MNDNWRKSISLAHKKNGFLPTKASESNKVKVSQFTMSGEFIKTWDSITDAAKAVGLKGSYTIGAVCKNKRLSSGGFKWSYYID
jgi:hypothetical protein